MLIKSMGQDFNTDNAGDPIDSRYFLALAGGGGWLAGIWLASRLDVDAQPLILSGVAFVLGAVFLWRRGRAGLVMATLAALALGGARYLATQPSLDPYHLHYYNGVTNVVALGNIVEEPTAQDTNVRIKVGVDELLIDGVKRPIEGSLMVQTGRFPVRAYGDRVRLTGDISSLDALNSPGFAASLEREGIRSVMEFPQVENVGEGNGSPLTKTLLRIKARGREIIQTILPEPHAALLTGILLGDSSGMPRSLSDDFRETGMTHIIAISG